MTGTLVAKKLTENAPKISAAYKQLCNFLKNEFLGKLANKKNGHPVYKFSLWN